MIMVRVSDKRIYRCVRIFAYLNLKKWFLHVDKFSFCLLTRKEFNMEDFKSYYAIIPANVRYDKDLPPNAKLLYGEITALCNEKGMCWATNDYFAKLYDVSKTSISKWISLLVEKGYIYNKIIYREGSKEILNRYLTLVQYPIEEKLNRGIEEKLKENNTNNNNTLNNTNNIYIVEQNDISKNVIEHLNMRTGANYKYTTKKTKDLIKARIKEGFTLEDFKTVIDKMCIEWINTDMQKYLRPETLFGTKFESYLNREVKQRINNLHLSSEDINEIFNFN